MADDLTEFAMIATKRRVMLPVPPNSDAKKMYVMAKWFNERGELGPASAVVSRTFAA